MISLSPRQHLLSHDEKHGSFEFETNHNKGKNRKTATGGRLASVYETTSVDGSDLGTDLKSS